jgi:hypothetical protein
MRRALQIFTPCGIPTFPFVEVIRATGRTENRLPPMASCQNSAERACRAIGGNRMQWMTRSAKTIGKDPNRKPLPRFPRHHDTTETALKPWFSGFLGDYISSLALAFCSQEKIWLTTVRGLSHQASCGTHPKKLKASTMSAKFASVRSLGIAITNG